MPVKGSILNKMMILIVVLLAPVLLLFFYFYHVSESNTRREIGQSAAGRIQFFLSQVETQLEQMQFYTAQIARDPSLHELQAIGLGADMFSKWKTVSNLSEKLRLLSSSNRWENRITLYMPGTKEVVSTDSSSYDDALFGTPLDSGWVRQPVSIYGKRTPGLAYRLIEPASYRMNPGEANFIVEVAFAERSLTGMLDQFKTGSRGDPFFYSPVTGVIRNGTSDPASAEAIAASLPREPESERISLSARTPSGEYMVYAVYSERLGMYLVDYYPRKLLLASIHNSRTIFYLSVSMLLLISLIATFMFHRHVQSPIRELVRGVQRLKKGHYSFRVKHRKSSEFQFLFERFNGMAAEIQTLIEHVYEEKLRSREAVLKQLQSQINPHFLYNSLNTVKTMSMIGNDEAVESMIVNLGEFYRYTTRTEKRLATLREEIDFVRNYLSIQQLRMPRLQTEIDLPAAMEKLEIPRILLQPIVENAIVHGIENSLGAGIVEVKGEWEEDRCRIIVSDNGKGLTADKLARLSAMLAKPMTEETGCGLWNVHQRLQLEFGSEAGLSFKPSRLGGLDVILQWPDRKGGMEHVSHSDRG